MKHGFLITAYKNAKYLVNLVDQLDGRDSYFYIHIDRKSDLLGAEVIGRLVGRPNVRIFSRYRVNWGSYAHLKAIVLLAEMALQDAELDYFHTLTGQCFPIKSNGQIFSFFEKNKGKSFINYLKVPVPGWDVRGGWGRLDVYRFNDLADIRHGWGRRADLWLRNCQESLKLKRSWDKEFPPLYAGSTWWSLGKDCLEYSIRFAAAHPKFYQRFRFTHCAEEFFFQTILLSSPFRHSIVNDNLRHIDWRRAGDNSPAVLDVSDFEALTRGGNLFARKFEDCVSTGLMDMLRGQLGIDQHD